MDHDTGSQGVYAGSDRDHGAWQPMKGLMGAIPELLKDLVLGFCGALRLCVPYLYGISTW